MNTTPRSQIKVFISSAQNEENGFDWATLRRKIKSKLSECSYINPFIIEDGASEIPSTQLFSYQVQCSDIVVLLVKGEFRSGTSAEFAVAKQAKKPFLIYFIEESDPTIDVIKLKNEIEQNDYCTYRGHLNISDDIEAKVYDDVINDVIQFYQYKHFIQSKNTDDAVALPESSISDSKPYVMNKVALTYFKSCYNEIFDLLGYKFLKDKETIENSLFHSLGINLVKWLITGESFFDASAFAELVEKAKDIYANVHPFYMGPVFI